MSLVCESGLDPIRPFKLFDKNSDFLKSSLKLVVLVLLLGSISLFLRSIFSGQTRWFNDPTRNIPVVHETHVSGALNISHIVFGIGGSTRTWSDRRHYSELWWNPNRTRGFVWLDEKPDPNSTWPDTSPPYRVSEDWTRFKYSSSRAAVRIARIIVETFRVGLPNVRWFVMGDDDTVFFTDNLVSVLARYDHKKMWYIGGNSESVEQDVMHSYDMAFGGGGFAVSYPLAKELVNVMDGCLDRYYRFYGSDQRVWACVNEIGVSLSRERGFHQIDIRGDPYGLLAAHPVAPLVSLHHLDSVKPLFPNQTQLESLRTLTQAYRVDPARTLQQSFCYYPTWKQKWSISISWGYTVQIYPSLLTASELERPMRTFLTWRSWKNGPFTFNTRPVNPYPCEQPVLYYLDWVKEVGNGESVSGYKKYGKENECGKADYRRAVERIIVSAAKMDPGEFKAPRRQCSEISSLRYGKMKVRIRSCKPGETITS
ncbi:hypothetical protein LguiA_034927 [Lonicera macranthoides]